MKIGSISENKQIEKRIAVTPDIAKKYIDFGFEVSLSENYGEHLGFHDREYNAVGVKICKNEKEATSNADIIIQLGLPVDEKTSLINENQTFSSLTCANIPNWSCHNAGVNAYGILNMVARSRYDSRINDAPFRVFTFISGDFDRGLQKSDTAHFILRDTPSYFSGLWAAEMIADEEE